MTVSGHCASRALKVSLLRVHRTSATSSSVTMLRSGTLATGTSSNSMCQEKTKEARAMDSPKIREEHRAGRSRAGPLLLETVPWHASDPLGSQERPVPRPGRDQTDPG